MLNLTKLKPGSSALYTIQSENVVGLFADLGLPARDKLNDVLLYKFQAEQL